MNAMAQKILNIDDKPISYKETTTAEAASQPLNDLLCCVDCSCEEPMQPCEACMHWLGK